jgi:hypothetical protein
VAKVSWLAASDGRYWIDVLIAGRVLSVMIDLGLVDPLDAVGFELEPAAYDQIKQAGLLSRLQYRFRRDANAQVTASESGLTVAQLFDPVSGQRFGPTVQLHVCRGIAGVPNRVGVVFFHRLVNCTVHWELNSRTWRIECE